MTEGAAALWQSVKGRIVSSEGRTFQKAVSCSNRKLYQKRGSVYENVGKFMTHRASNFQKVQLFSTNGSQQIQ